MPNIVVVGTQWGDEGKGKVVDVLTPGMDAVVRFQGGNNAGHTLVVDGERVILHLLPSGVLRRGCLNIVGNGVVVDPRVLMAEIDALAARGLPIGPDRLLVSSEAQVILPYHQVLDREREQAAGLGRIGTTGRGIGPAYEDKVARRGVRMGDLLHPGVLRERLERVVAEKNRMIYEWYHGELVDIDQIEAEYIALGERLRPFIGDTVGAVHRVLQRKGQVLFEGAQGTFLDVDHGTYPFVTSSNCVAGAACAGAGVGPRVLEEVVGIAKAYTTRVGAGPFPSEVHGAVGDHLREAGREFGSTTGRPRRCGWFDAPLVRQAARLNGLGRLALMKLDVLTGLPSIPVCVAYEGTADFPTDLGAARPILEEMPGWSEPLDGCRTRADLPTAARRYVERLEELVGVPIEMISVGPDREQTIASGLLARP